MLHKSTEQRVNLPQCLRVVSIVPIHKGGTRSDVGN